MSREVNILLVEDDQVDIMAVQRAFKQRKIANPLTIANDGLEALAILRGSKLKDPLAPPFIIILDLNMPRMSGLEFLEELRNDPTISTSIVFVLTTSKDDQDRAKAYEKHIAGYITKSDFDSSFLDAVTMLESFWKIIEFP
jgi:CheY-like chemotaxis protein